METTSKGKSDVGTLDQLVTHAKGLIQSVYDQSDDPKNELTTMFVAVAPDGLMVVATPFVGDSKEQVNQCKDGVCRAMAMLFAAKHVTHYVMISECWVAEVDAKHNPELMDVPPSERNDRREVVAIIGADKSGRKIGTAFQIERSPDKPPRVGEKDSLFEHQVEGRMAELLDTPEMPEKMRREVLEMFDKARISGDSLSQTMH
jgi:hypothetical protein